MAQEEALVSGRSQEGWLSAESKAEILGTFTLILGGCSVVANAQRRDVDGAPPGDHHAQALYINLGWAIAVTLGVIVSFEASGAHLNPAVTFQAMLFDGFGLEKGLKFIAMQFIGAMLAAFVCCIMFTRFPEQDQYVKNFYHTGPSANTGILNAFLVEIIGTAVLLYGIKFIATGGPPKPNKYVMGFGVGTIIFFIGMCLGYQTGYSLNPARELGPRIIRFLDLALRGKGTFETFDNWNWLAPVFGPLIGAPLGVLIWKFCSKPEEKQTETSVEMS